MTIRVYTPLVPGQQIGDDVEYEGNLLILLRGQEDGISLEDKRDDFHVTVNGKTVPFKLYEETHLDRDDDVRIYIAPKGGIVKAIGGLLGGIFKVVFGLFGINQSKGDSSRGTSVTGQNLEASSIRANTPRMGATVPEQFGRYKRFCDSLNEQRRFYVNKRDQYVDALLHITVGQVTDISVFLGTTPIGDVSGSQYWIHQPGANLAGHDPAQLWHNNPAVGGTAGGTAGLELPTELGNRINTQPASYSFNDNEITRSDGEFPPGWGEGTIIGVNLPLTYDVQTNPPFQNQSIFTGNFRHLMPIANGDFVTVTGVLSGYFYISDLSINANGVGSLRLWRPGTPPTEGTPGTDPAPVLWPSTGDQVITFRGRDFTITSHSDDRLTVNGNFPSVSSSGATVEFIGGTVYGEWSSRFVATPSGALSSIFEVDFFMPEGLTYINEDGTLASRTVSVQIEYRDLNTPGAVYTQTRTYTDATRDQIGYTERFTLPQQSRIQVRIRRIGAKSNSTQVMDTVQWYGLRARLPDKNSYPWTTMTVRLKSGNKLGSQSENQINVVSTRMLPELLNDGTMSGLVPTRDIAAAAIRVSQGAGYQLSDWHPDIIHLNQAYWKPRGETFDFILDETTVKGALDSILTAGFSELTSEHGFLKPVRDIPRTAFDQGFSPQNILGEVTETTRQHRDDDNDGYEVEYTSSETWEKMTIKCLVPGSLGVRLRSLKLEGVTQKHIAWRIGMRRAMADLYRRTGYSFRTEAAGLNAYYLGFISLITTLRNWGQSFNLIRVDRSGDKALLFLSEKMVFDDIAPPYVAAVSDFQGRVIGPFPAVVIDDGLIEISGIPNTTTLPVPTLDKQLPAVYFGQQNRMSYQGLVQTVNPEQGLYAKIEAINYDDRVYTYDDQFPTE